MPVHLARSSTTTIDAAIATIDRVNLRVGSKKNWQNDDFKTETSWSKFINKFVPDKVMTSLKSESNYEKLVLYMTGNSFMKYIDVEEYKRMTKDNEKYFWMSAQNSSLSDWNHSSNNAYESML